MPSKVELLPLPEDYDQNPAGNTEVQDYARACVAHAIAAKWTLDWSLIVMGLGVAVWLGLLVLAVKEIDRAKPSCSITEPPGIESSHVQ